MAYQNKCCKVVAEYIEEESVLLRVYTSSSDKWSTGDVHKNLENLHYLNIVNDKILKIHPD